MEQNTLQDKIILALKTCYDPEIPVNIYDLGLIYDIALNQDNVVVIQMTLTSPNCPSIESLPMDVRDVVASVDGIKSVDIDLVWEPPFSQDMMSDEAKLTLGLL